MTKRFEIAYLLKNDVKALIGTTICVKGWVRTKRGNKNVAFIAINDGSIIHNIQVVADPTIFEEELRRITTGACLILAKHILNCRGRILKTLVQNFIIFIIPRIWTKWFRMNIICLCIRGQKLVDSLGMMLLHLILLKKQRK